VNSWPNLHHKSQRLNIRRLPELLCGAILLLLSLTGSAQNEHPTDTSAGKSFTHEADSQTIYRKRLRSVIIAEAGVYTVSMAGLYTIWYKDYPQSHFHFFDDNDEWLQMDKAGHFVTSYYISRLAAYSVRWAGMSRQNSIWYGGVTGFTYMTAIEILDGFSSEWGASAGDLVANTSGALLYVGQELLWRDQRIILKYSWHQSDYAGYRPDLLGRNWPQQIIKDYNGTTLWLSANLRAFGASTAWLPEWLNLAVGYGAEGMTGASANSLSYNGHPVPQFDRYRQFYLSLDIDMTRIPVKSKWLRLVFNAIGFLKIPAPALEYNTKGKVIFHPLYF